MIELLKYMYTILWFYLYYYMDPLTNKLYFLLKHGVNIIPLQITQQNKADLIKY